MQIKSYNMLFWEKEQTFHGLSMNLQNTFVRKVVEENKRRGGGGGFISYPCCRTCVSDADLLVDLLLYVLFANEVREGGLIHIPDHAFYKTTQRT